MNDRTLRIVLFSGFVFLVVRLLAPDPVQAVPSYARQTKLPCTSCHIVFPELNAYGRHFKLQGYTHTSSDTIDSTLLKLLKTPPLAVMGQVSFTNLKEKEPGAQNNNFAFPQQLSLFLSGEITPKLGSFIQVTYDDQSGSFGWDNTDIRLAGHGTVRKKRDLIYGATLNNNPTVQDVWNSTPAWGFPYATSNVAPTPAAATLIDGGLAQEVLGLGGYCFYANTVYGEFTLYRSAQQGAPQPPDATSANVIRGVSPYWRFAIQHEWTNQYLEVGTYGLWSKIYPQGISGETNQYTDAAIDAEYHGAVGANGEVVAHGTWIHERQKLNAFYAAGISENQRNTINTVRFDASYYYRSRLGPSFAYFSTTGTRDTGLYSPAPVFGSGTGKPDSHGVIAQFSYFPWLNVRLSLQYIAYFEFNGSKNNYDGFGRDASDNNTLYALAWINF